MLGRARTSATRRRSRGPCWVNALFVLILVVGPPAVAYAMYHGYCRPRTGILLALAVLTGAWVVLLRA